MELVWLLLGGPRLRSGRSVWVFLASGHFAAKAPAHEPRLSWISLDSLCPNRDFLMGIIYLTPC